MNRPLALIEGDLALPIARPFDALPPPFGSRRRLAQTTAQREPHPAPLTASQLAIPNAVQRQASLARRGLFPPGAKFLFFYKLPKQRDHSHKFEEQLAEARYYLEMGKARPSSTRSDRVLGAAIFAGCSIALAWLLATCRTHDAAKATTMATAKATTTATAKATTVTQPVASTDGGSAMAAHPQERAQHVEHLVPHPTARVSTRQVAPRQPTTALRQVPIARLSRPQTDERLALSRATNPATQPSASKQPEWTARPSSANDAAERAALLDWAVQQRRANITTRANMPAAGDIDWNARMAQRRITDNPDAFQPGGVQK